MTRWRLQAVFNRLNKDLRSRRDERLSLSTYHLQAIVILLVLLVVLIIIIGATSLQYRPISFPIIWALAYLLLGSINLFQVMLITAPSTTWKYSLCGLCGKNDEDASSSLSITKSVTNEANSTTSQASQV